MTITATAMLRAALSPRHLILSMSRASECLLQTAAAAVAVTTAAADNHCGRSLSTGGSKSARTQDYESIIPCNGKNLLHQSRRNLHHDRGDYCSANNDNLRNFLQRPKHDNSSVPPPNNNFENSAKKEDNDNYIAAFNPEDGPPRTSVLMELIDRVGALHDVLKFL